MTKDTMVLFGNRVSPSISTSQALKTVGSEMPASIGFFNSGEPFVELRPTSEQKQALRGAQVALVQSAGEPVGDNVLHLLQMVSNLKRYGAARITVVMPFAPFDRQDREFKDRCVSVSAELLPQLLKAAGASNVVRITPHSRDAVAFYEKEFGRGFKALSTAQLFAEDIKKRFADALDKLVIGAPDGADKPHDEGQARAKELAESVFQGSEAPEHKRFMISKTHTGVSDTKITHFEGDVSGKDCVVIDDMIDGGSTMINAASLVKSKGARSVTAYATHGILSGNALEKILSAKPDGIHHAIDHLVVTDTMPDVQQKIETLRNMQPALAERVSVVSVAPMIAQELEQQKQYTHSAGLHGKPAGRQHN